MKNILLILLFCSNMYGQKITVTSEGFRSADEPEKSYVVIPVEGKTATELYQSALKYINKAYKNPEEVIKGNIENEYLKFNTYASNFITIKNSFLKTPFSANYTTELNFKDGKVKLEIISIEMKEKGNFPLYFKGQGFMSGYYIYGNKNELKRQEAKDQIESYFNAQVLLLADALQNKITEEKW